LDYPEKNCERCEEIYEVDSIEPDCENCDLPILLQANMEVMDLYDVINTQFVHDFNALGLVFEVFGISCTRSEAKEMLDKLITIHGIKKEREIEDRNREMDALRLKAK